MLNNQNSIKVPWGPVHSSLLKVSGDNCRHRCRRFAAVFKSKSPRIGWLAFTRMQKHSVNTDSQLLQFVPLCLRLCITNPTGRGGKTAALQRELIRKGRQEVRGRKAVGWLSK